MLGKNHDIALQNPSVEVQEEPYEDLSAEQECVSKQITHSLLDDLSDVVAWQKSHSSDWSQASNDCWTQGLAYIAGYFARKFAVKYPHLGGETCDINFVERTSTPWIIHLSNGRLSAPSEQVLQA